MGCGRLPGAGRAFPLAGQYWSFGYRSGDRRFMVAGVEPGPALPVPPSGLPVVVRSNAD